MPIHVACPECRSTYDLVDDQQGKKVRCKKCQFVFIAEPMRNGRQDVVRDVEVVAERVSRAPVKKAAPPISARKTVQRVEDDDDDDEDRDARRRPTPRKKKSGGASTGLLIGGLAALLVVVVVGVVGLIVVIRYMGKDDKVPNPTIVDNSKPPTLIKARSTIPPIIARLMTKAPAIRFRPTRIRTRSRIPIRRSTPIHLASPRSKSPGRPRKTRITVRPRPTACFPTKPVYGSSTPPSTSA